MAIFRCSWCSEVFDLSSQFNIEGLLFCGKCHSIYKEKLKPKPARHPMDDVYEPEEIIKPTKKKRK